MSEQIPIATLEDKLEGAPCTLGSVLDESDIDRPLGELRVSRPEARMVRHARLSAMNLQSLSMASGALITWAAFLQMFNAKLIQADWVKVILMLGPISLVFLFGSQLQAGSKKRR